MEQYFIFIFFILFILGARLLKAYLEKQQHSQEAAKKAPPQGNRMRQTSQELPGSRLRDQLEALLQGKMPPDAGKPTPPPPRPEQPHPRRPATLPRPPHAASRPSAEGHPQPAARPAAALRPAQAVRHRGQARPQTRAPAAAAHQAAPTAVRAPRPARPAQGAGVCPTANLGNMLRGGNLARAIVLVEILGPPKGLG